MNWYEVWTNVAAAVLADDEFAAVMGTALYLAGSRAVEIPSATALLVVDTESEVWAPAEWQFDLYTRSMEELMAAEKALRRILNQPLQVTLGDAKVTCEFLSGQLLHGPERDPYFRRLLEFRFTPVRSRYYRPPIAQES